MDGQRFDAIVKSVGIGRSRRDAVQILGGGALALAVTRLLPFGAAAKKRGKKKKHKKRCIPNWKTCDLSGGKRCCTGRDHCCLEYSPRGAPSGGPYCAGKNRQCCPPSAGGGDCSLGEICCPITQRYRGVNDYCESIGGECCDDEVGGSCGPGLACCIDLSQSPEYTCCPKVPAAGLATESRVPRNFKLRGGQPAQ
jgi:hypothetical protein